MTAFGRLRPVTVMDFLTLPAGSSLSYYTFFRSLPASLRSRCVDLAVAAGTHGDDENLDFLTVDVIDDADILGSDAAVARELIEKR
jgi:hypothetical protein